MRQHHIVNGTFSDIYNYIAEATHYLLSHIYHELSSAILLIFPILKENITIELSPNGKALDLDSSIAGSNPVSSVNGSIED